MSTGLDPASVEAMRAFMADVLIHVEIRDVLKPPPHVQTYNQLREWLDPLKEPMSRDEYYFIDGVFRAHYREQSAIVERSR